jgi:hypothetical protein
VKGAEKTLGDQRGSIAQNVRLPLSSGPKYRVGDFSLMWITPELSTTMELVSRGIVECPSGLGQVKPVELRS